jgi:aspartate racemase
MKKIGILGGLAWPSTVEYYAGICRLAEARHTAAGLPGAAAMPEMSIESLDVVRAASLLGDDDDEASWAAFDEYHRAGLRRLERSGADLALIACNTAHLRFAQITRDIGIPVTNVLEVAASACARRGISRMLILGTMPTMHSHILREVFARHGIEANPPHGHRRQRAITATIEALQHGRTDGVSRRIRAIVGGRNAGPWQAPAAVYLGCTELSLAFPAYRTAEFFEVGGIRHVNSTVLHLRATFAHATAP